MNDEVQQTEIPKWFLIVSIIALLWNLMGLSAFVMMMLTTEAQMAESLPEKQELYKNTPIWVSIAFALAVIAGTLGSVGLVMRKKWAMPVLILSLLGVIAQQTYMFFLSNTFEVEGSAAMALPILVLIIAIALVWFSKMSIGKNWLT